MKDGRGYFANPVVDCGEVAAGSHVSGRFMLNCVKKIVECDSGCTCGGKPKVECRWDDDGFVFSTVANVIGGEKDVVRMVNVKFEDRDSQIVYVKYRVR